MRQSVILYSTEHCSLCDQALGWLLAARCMLGVTLNVVDVSADETLLARYGAHIPVLRIGEQDIPWPFAEAAIKVLLHCEPGASAS